VLLGFLLNTSGAETLAQSTTLLLPPPTQFVHPSPNYSHPVLKGLKFNPDTPLKVEFIIDTANKAKVSQEEASKLIKYFLAALTMPKQDIWVNLSPYEADTIAEEHLSQTDLGKDLLSQDFILKQLSSSLTYPDSETGKDFWKQTYKQVIQLAGTTNLPINTFNKVWIVPEAAEVYENKDTALITQARLDVLLEEDYLSLHQNINTIQNHQSHPETKLIKDINQASSKVMKQLILPKIKRDVNFGKNFANLRQIYHSLILGFWFKDKFKDSIYKHYINQAKIKGINLKDTDSKEKIYQHYLKAFKGGLYDYIKADYDPKSKAKIRRRYFSGGSSFTKLDTTTRTRYQLPPGVNDADQLLIGTATRVVTQARAAKRSPEEYALASSTTRELRRQLEDSLRGGPGRKSKLWPFLKIKQPKFIGEKKNVEIIVVDARTYSRIDAKRYAKGITRDTPLRSLLLALFNLKGEPKRFDREIRIFQGQYDDKALAAIYDRQKRNRLAVAAMEITVADPKEGEKTERLVIAVKEGGERTSGSSSAGTSPEVLVELFRSAKNVSTVRLDHLVFDKGSWVDEGNAKSSVSSRVPIIRVVPKRKGNPFF